MHAILFILCQKFCYVLVKIQHLVENKLKRALYAYPSKFKSLTILQRCFIWLTLSQTMNFRLFQTETNCRRQCRTWQRWWKVLCKRRKRPWEKEKLLVTSNFSSSHRVLKRLVLQPLQPCRNSGLFVESIWWSLIYK